MQPTTVTYTDSKQGLNIPQSLCYIWAQTRELLNLCSNREFTWFFLYLHFHLSQRLHLCSLFTSRWTQQNFEASLQNKQKKLKQMKKVKICLSQMWRSRTRHVWNIEADYQASILFIPSEMKKYGSCQNWQKNPYVKMLLGHAPNTVMH